MLKHFRPKIMRKIFYTTKLCLLFVLANGCNTTDTKCVLLSPGDWFIVNAQEDGRQQQQEYAMYTFRFNSNNTVKASLNNLLYNGEWHTDATDVTDDDPIVNEYLSISFHGNSALVNLNGNYNIVSQSKDIIALELPNAMGGPAINLTLKKIK